MRRCHLSGRPCGTSKASNNNTLIIAPPLGIGTFLMRGIYYDSSINGFAALVEGGGTRFAVRTAENQRGNGE